MYKLNPLFAAYFLNYKKINKDGNIQIRKIYFLLIENQSKLQLDIFAQALSYPRRGKLYSGILIVSL